MFAPSAKVDFIMTKILMETNDAGAVKSADSDGTYPVVLISPGQGASGYYSEEVIREYAPRAWPRGTHVYMDHLKPGETRSPERLLGALVAETTINESGEAVNRFLPIGKHREWVEDVHKLVGLSISASGDGRDGEVNGRNTFIVESLDESPTNTVDIVSFAGRGGRFIESYFENEGGSTQSESSAGSTKGNRNTMAFSEEQVTALVESVNALVAKMTATPVVEEEPVDTDALLKEERAKAVEAAKAVDAAELTESVKATLYKRIEAGDYDVASAIEADKALREEIRQDLEARVLTEAGASASGGKKTESLEVQGW